MKKFLLAIIVAASLASPPSVEAQEKPVDLIVLLDSSQSMFPFFTEVVDFVVSRIAREYLRFGDTFHLLTFTDTVQIEIAQSVRTEQDIKRLLGRLYLLYPLGKSTDLVSALSSLYRYTADLPESNRKLIVMVTDGMHNPSPQSPYASLSSEEVRSDIERTTAKIRENGWTIRIVRVPFNGTGVAGTSAAPGAGGAGGSGSGAVPGSGGSGAIGETLGSSPGAGDYLSEVASGLGAPVTDFSADNKEDAALRSVEIPHATFPGPLGRVGYDFSFPLGLSNPSARDLRLELSGVYSRGGNLLRRNIFVEIPAGAQRSVQIPLALPNALPTGDTSLDIELRFADGVRVVPTTGVLSFELVRKPFARLFRTTGRVVLFLVLLVLVLALIVFAALYVRGLHKKAERPIVSAVLDSEAAAAAERREALAAARTAGPARVTTEEARAFRSALVPKHVTADEVRALGTDMSQQHVTAEEAQAFQADLSSKRLTAEEALAFQTDLSQKHVTQEEARIFGEARSAITEEEAKRFASSNAITQEEAARYRDATSQNAAETLAAFAAATSPNRRVSSDAAAYRPSDFAPVVKRTGSLRIEFQVEDQNPHIGLRNVRTLHSGAKKTIGGNRSDFLIFLVAVPPRVAEVFYDGEDLTILPLKPEYFPDYNGPIGGCLNGKVRMVTRHGKTLTLSFAPYVPPAERLNRLLHCVDAPGFASLDDISKSNEGAE